MRVQIVLTQSEEGFAVCAPSLPGCWSQGATSAEAIDNIRDAISEYLETENGPPADFSAQVPAGSTGMPSLADGVEIRELEIAD
jgi:predicted RNase H-like HicB family nuclease